MSRFLPFDLAQKFAFLPKNLARDTIAASLTAFPARVPRAWQEYLARELRTVHLASLNEVQLHSASLRASGLPDACLLANLMDFQSVVRPKGLAFVRDELAPEGIEQLYKWGAQQLHELGQDQARRLAQVAVQLTQWAVEQLHDHVVVVDSPLGGTVPAQVICKTLGSRGVHAEIREFLAPRLDSHAEKYSIKKAAADFCKALPLGDYPIVFPDEVLTGTRFGKLYGALRKHLGDRLVPVALWTHSWSHPTDEGEKLKRLRAKISALPCAKQGAPVFTRFPPAILIKVDGGPPITLNAPFFWAEQDLAAGKRKVNLVFSLIAQIKTIGDDLKDERGVAIRHLESLWSRGSEGSIYVHSEPFLRQTIPKLVSALDWNAIEHLARQRFGDEYTGQSTPTSLVDVSERLNWLLGAVRDQLEPIALKDRNEASEAWMVANAFHDLYALAHGGRWGPSPRDRDFCESTIALAYPDSEFHEELVLLVQGHI